MSKEIFGDVAKHELWVSLVVILTMLLLPYAAKAQSSWYTAPSYNGSGAYGYDNYGNSFNSRSLYSGGAETTFSNGAKIRSRQLYNGGYEHTITPGPSYGTGNRGYGRSFGLR